MIVKLDSTYHAKVMEYLKREPEFNLFIIGDIERYGYDNYFLSIWADINKRGSIDAILLKYFGFLIFYSDYKYDKDDFFYFLKDVDYSEISGKTDCLEKLASKLKCRKIREVKFCKLENEKFLKENEKNVKLKRVKFGNIGKVVNLYESIDEFENTTVENIKNSLKTGRGYCIEVDRKVVAMAKSTSENNTHAMLVGIGTHPKYRNKGYATKCTKKICMEIIKDHKIPCLFYDNEAAGRIYKKLGFKEIGKWSIYYR
ncbi:GNAT family N-acetyltransferase [Romboutsia maritimum]|uniref:GNAT family N-acetyltransferase n=1 Tax=Romboutsia maritimum TaxID=2020948 RepID=A0A371IWC3_9FIRM|nr:GNAT family N-acetyltransferase [Romboutsia maritimum]RDY24787.1 GNAT family N-acetyltransferase [Romboutsia maritimum]